MELSRRALAKAAEQFQSRLKWPASNYMIFPQELRDAIPGPELPGCDRCLILSGMDGRGVFTLIGRRVQLRFLAEESGRLNGAFAITVDLNVEAARALVKTLQDLVEREEN